MLAEIALFPEQASTTAANVDKLFFFQMSICGAMGLLVAVLLIFFSVYYRRRPQRGGPAARNGLAICGWNGSGR